ncbi:MAG: zinc ABC transporter substrate-binding protein [Candidatus Omnitrophica bacterium]|nr:zinc ABC transporter substrate-binding protein [Candidatus Omnitrophota bacterium]
MKKWISLILFALVFLPSSVFAAEKIRVVTTTTTLESLVREIARDKVDIHHVASPIRDIHYIQPNPKDLMMLKKAKIFVHLGLDLEAWRDAMLVAAGNPSFLRKDEGAIDVSVGVPLLEIPTTYSRTEGDIHAFGNPHYAIDPENAKIMAKNIADGFSRIFPDDAGYFKQNLDKFNQKIEEKMKVWQTEMAPYRGAPIVTYHKSWPYFVERFGLETLGELEPKPGIPPTAKHLAELERIMKERGVKIIIIEPFNETSTPRKVSKDTGARVLNLIQNVNGKKEAPDYFSMIDYDINQIVQALK